MEVLTVIAFNTRVLPTHQQCAGTGYCTGLQEFACVCVHSANAEMHFGGKTQCFASYAVLHVPAPSSM